MAAPTRTTPSTPERLDERELRAWRGMLRVHSALTKALDADLEAAHGLALSSYEVLIYLEDAPGRRLRMHDLAESVLLSRSGLTRLVDRMERDGLIARESCPEDARGSFAKLTPEGLRRLKEVQSTHRFGIRALFLDRLSTEDLDALGEIWEKVLPGVTHASDACSKT